MMSSRMAGEKAKPAALSKASASVRESLSASASWIAVCFETGRSSLPTMAEYVLRLIFAAA